MKCKCQQAYEIACSNYDLITEVKQSRPWLVLGWVTAKNFFSHFNFFLIFFHFISILKIFESKYILMLIFLKIEISKIKKMKN